MSFANGTDTRARNISILVRRASLVLFGLVAGCVLLEILLQLGAKLLRPERPVAIAPRWPSSAIRILALGDSNTYGLYVGREAAYPQLLERMWNDRNHALRVEVLNLGYPGTNSSQVLVRCNRYLEGFRPDIVTLMIGVNDAWTQPVSTEAETSLGDSLRQLLWRKSRLYRFGYMLVRAREHSSLEVIPLSDPLSVTQGRGIARFGNQEFELGHRMSHPTARAGWIERAESNLRNIVQCVRSWDVPLVLITYPSGHFLYSVANHLLRAVAQSTGTPLVDVNKAIEPHCPNWECEELLADHHPSERGHVRIAQALVEFFASQFRQEAQHSER